MSFDEYEVIPSKNLQRVSTKLSTVILEFCRKHVGQTFRMENMRAFIQFHGHHCAPASPDRILGDLRKAGVVNYEVVSRKGSLYRITQCTA